MRSDAGRPWYEHPIVLAVGSVRASVVLGFTTAALLGAASFFVPNPRSRDALPFHESVRVFFDPVDLKFTWFYLLLVATFFYGVNGLVGTLSGGAQRHARGTFDLRFSGIFLMHAGFVLALVAHLVAGFGTDVEGRYLLSSQPVEIAGRTAVLRDPTEVHHPDGTLRTFTSTLDLGGGDLRTLGYNQPVFLDGFTRWILVEAPKPAPGAPAFTWHGAAIQVGPDGRFQRPDVPYELVRVSMHRSLKAPMASLRPLGGGEMSWLGPGMTTDEGLRFDGLSESLGVSVVLRRNDGLPWVFVASAVFAAGLALFSADAWRRRMGNVG